MTEYPSTKILGKPRRWLGLLVSLLLVAVWGYLRLVAFPNFIMPLTYVLPLMVCIWTRDKKVLWAMAGAFILMAVAKILWVMPRSEVGYDDWAQFSVTLVNIVVGAGVVRLVLWLRDRVALHLDALAQNQERLAMATSATRVGMFDWNLASSSVLWTQTHDAIFGYAPGATTTTTTTEYDYRRWVDRVHPEDLSRVEEETRRCRQGGKPLEVQYRIIWPDGSLHWIETRGVFLNRSDGEGTRMLGVVMDITERKRTDEAVSRSQKTFLDLVERSPFGTYIVDAQFRIAMMNASSQTGAFRNVRPVIGRLFTEAMRILWPEPVAAEIIDHFRHTLDTGEPYFSRDFIRTRGDIETVEAYEWELHRMTLPDGQYGVICYYYDSSKLRETEAALRESEERFRVAQELSPDGFSILRPVRDPEGRVLDFTWVYANAATERMVGTELPALEGRSLLELFPDHQGSPLLEAYRQVAETGQTRVLESHYQGDGVLAGRWFRVAVVATAREIAVLSQDITVRKQAEEALRRRETDLNEAQRVAHVGSWHWDAATDVTTGSDELVRIYGFDPATDKMPDFKDQPGLCYPVEDWERINAGVQKAMETGVGYELDVRVKRKGEMIWVTTRGEVVRDAAGRIVALRGTVQDITERKRAEEALRQSEAELSFGLELNDALRQLDDPIQIQVTATRLLGERLQADRVFINKIVVEDGIEITVIERDYHRPGLSPVTGRFPFREFSQTDYENYRAGRTVCSPNVFTDGREPSQSEAYRAAGVAAFIGVPVVKQGKVLGILGILQSQPRNWTPEEIRLAEQTADRTWHAVQRARTEEALAASELRYRRLFESAKDGILILDAETGMVVDVNPFLIEKLGLSREVFLGKKVWELGFFKNIVANQDKFKELQEKEYIRYEDLPLETEDGRKIDVECVSNLYRVNHHKVIQCNIRDITERKQAEDALRRTAEEMARSNRELEQFAYIASHDLQEPLRQVRAFVQILRDRHADRFEGKAAEYFQFVYEGAGRMSDLVRGLLDYSRASAKDRPREPISCQKVLDTVLADLQTSIAESHAQITHDELPTTTAEPSQMTQLFQNLIANAIKFRRDGVTPEIHVGCRRDHGSWLFSVRDNGIGIDPAHYQKVFVIFQRLHGPGKYAGTGIGLAICKKVVEQYGGRIWIESKPGEGSTFYFTLPEAKA